jgi:colicin import membrane protein
MKKLITILLITGLAFGGPAFAQQGKDKNHPDKTQNGKPAKDDKEKNNNKDKTKETGKDKENPGKGNAYGKNKDSLQGKDFGQNRAQEAKNKKEAIEQTETNLTQVSQTNADTKTKIKQAREKLEAKKKGKKISDVDYNKKKKALDDLEKEVDGLEKQNTEIKGKLDKEKAVNPE